MAEIIQFNLNVASKSATVAYVRPAVALDANIDAVRPEALSMTPGEGLALHITPDKTFPLEL